MNYPVLPKPKQGQVPIKKYMVDTLTGVINQLKGVPDLTCIMLVKIEKIWGGRELELLQTHTQTLEDNTH